MSEEQTTIHTWDVSETREYAIVQDANGVIHIYRTDDNLEGWCTEEVSAHDVATHLLTQLITVSRKHDKIKKVVHSALDRIMENE